MRSLPTDHQQSTDSRSTVGQQMSCRKLSFQENLNKSVSQLLVRCWSTVDQLSANSWLTDCRQSAERLPTVSQQITNSQPTVGEGSCSSQLPTCVPHEIVFDELSQYRLMIGQFLLGYH